MKKKTAGARRAAANPPAFIVAAASSGSGKTTLTIGLLEALRLRGLKVQPFKAGPDYIDPGHHSAVLGVPSYNLDTWMMGPDAVKSTFASGMARADVGVVEGVMGLFDGRGGASGEGSTAHLARLLGLPVLLVVNSEKTAGSVAAVVRGFEGFEPGVDVRWVVFNRVASTRHYDMLARAVEDRCTARVLGRLPRSAALDLPERHLGLVTSADIRRGRWRSFVNAAASAVEDNMDIDGFLAELRHDAARNEGRADAAAGAARAEQARQAEGKIRIAVARDRAFCFYYEENLEILKGLGAELVPFSPMKSARLPRNVSGIYLGGGYPELHAASLEANSAMRREIKAASRSGMPIYAECGGLIYLGRSLRPVGGPRASMAGVFPWAARMLTRRAALGYREVTAAEGCPFLAPGSTVRGHEFHYSELSGAADRVRAALLVRAGDADTPRPEGFVSGNTLASYVHLHFASNPAFAGGFMARAEAYGRDTLAPRG